MIEWLEHHRELDAVDACMLCSTAANLRISEIVGAPNWVVSLHMPLDIFKMNQTFHHDVDAALPTAGLRAVGHHCSRFFALADRLPTALQGTGSCLSCGVEKNNASASAMSSGCVSGAACPAPGTSRRVALGTCSHT